MPEPKGPPRSPIVVFKTYGVFFEDTENDDVIMHCEATIFDPDGPATLFAITPTVRFSASTLPPQIEAALTTSAVEIAATFGITVSRSDVYLMSLNRGV